MFFRKQQRDPTTIGVEITPQNVKLLALTAIDNSYQVNHYAITPLPSHAILNNDIKDFMAVGATIKKAYQQNQFSSHTAVVSVPGSNVMIKKVTMDAGLNSIDMEEQAWIEAGKIFPNLIDNIHLDFCMLEPIKNNPSQVEVLLVACRKEQIQTRVDALKEGGLVTKAVDVDYYALERLLAFLAQQLPNEQTNQVIALLNIGSNALTLVVLENLTSLYAHDQTFDGQVLIDKVQTEFHIPDLLTPSLPEKKLSEAENTQLLTIFNDHLLTHLRHFFQYFYSTHAQKEIRHLFLSGECATIPNITSLITQQMGINTMLANPFANMAISPNIHADALRAISPAFALCCGLALHPLTL